jgi:hypothetical protein
MKVKETKLNNLFVNKVAIVRVHESIRWKNSTTIGKIMNKYRNILDVSWMSHKHYRFDVNNSNPEVCGIL